VNKKRELTKQRLEEFNKRKENFVPITRPTDFQQMAREEYDDYWKKNQPRDVQSDFGDSESE
jgi:sulfite oxidase